MNICRAVYYEVHHYNIIHPHYRGEGEVGRVIGWSVILFVCGHQNEHFGQVVYFTYSVVS